MSFGQQGSRPHALYWQNPVNSQPMAPPLALSWQHTMWIEQHCIVPSGQGASWLPAEVSHCGTGTMQQELAPSHSRDPDGQPQSCPPFMQAAPGKQQKSPHVPGWSAGHAQ